MNRIFLFKIKSTCQRVVVIQHSFLNHLVAWQLIGGVQNVPIGALFISSLGDFRHRELIEVPQTFL